MKSIKTIYEGLFGNNSDVTDNLDIIQYLDVLSKYEYKDSKSKKLILLPDNMLDIVSVEGNDMTIDSPYMKLDVKNRRALVTKDGLENMESLLVKPSNKKSSTVSLKASSITPQWISKRLIADSIYIDVENAEDVKLTAKEFLVTSKGKNCIYNNCTFECPNNDGILLLNDKYGSFLNQYIYPTFKNTTFTGSVYRISNATNEMADLILDKSFDYRNISVDMTNNIIGDYMKGKYKTSWALLTNMYKIKNIKAKRGNIKDHMLSIDPDFLKNINIDCPYIEMLWLSYSGTDVFIYKKCNTRAAKQIIKKYNLEYDYPCKNTPGWFVGYNDWNNIFKW